MSVIKNKITGITVRKRMMKFVTILILTSLSYIIMFQLFYMISFAIRPVSENLDLSVIWIPKNFTMENFKVAARVMEYGKSFARTLTVAIGSGLLEVVTCAIIAYGFARFEFRERNFVFMLVILTILIPPQMLLSPTYLNYTQLDFLGILNGIGKLLGREIRPHILDTPLTFYLPSFFGVGLRSGLFIFIYRQFFVNLPLELEEAAWVDGAGPIRTFISIIVPSSSVVILTVTIFSVIWHWNDYYLSTMYLGGHTTLAAKLSTLKATLAVTGSGVSDSRNIRMAACLIFILPVLVMYVIVQRRFVKSLDRVGIVG